MRTDGFLPIRDYALIGDGRTAALVGRDGGIDWLCLPNLDSPSTFASILDAGAGGACRLAPAVPFVATHRYLPDTNVVETTFRTAAGAVRVTDAMTLPGAGLAPMRELARVVDGLEGAVPLVWHVAPRFDYGAIAPRFASRSGVPVACGDGGALAVCHWNAGTPIEVDGALSGRFELAAGRRAVLALAYVYAEPLVLPARAEVEARVEGTIRFWRAWIAERAYDGPWAEMVRRSALALKLLIFAPSGAIVAAPTTSLPEELGGVRNWDYRFCWIRDSSFTIDALIELGCYDEAKALFWWFAQATALTEPELHVLYRLDGGVGMSESGLPLAGYRGSRPVRVGNGALDQAQLDIYGDLLETAWLFSEGHRALQGDIGAVLARIADHVCGIWRRPDSGIWEVRNGPFHFTHSKVMCWLALDRAARLAARGELPARHIDRWRQEAAAIEAFVERECWSPSLDSYTRIAGSDRVDASLLMLSLVGYGDPCGARIQGTIRAIERELRHDDLVYRYRADDGLPGQEGCFLNCSFWLVSALARAGRLDDACALMESLVARANAVGLYSEEIEPVHGAFLGNFPQALVHLALVDAAVAVRDALASERRRTPAERATARRDRRGRAGVGAGRR